MSALQWLNPWWLLLALLPLPLLAWRGKAMQHPRLEQFIQRHLWSRVLSAPMQSSNRNRLISFFIIWTLISIALAGPFIVEEKPEAIEKLAANIVVVMDISPSMGAQDVTPSRLEQAKKLIKDFSRQLEPHRLALIAFSANAYTVLPLTHDKQALRHFVDQLDPSLAYVSGSNLSRALRLAVEALANNEQTTGLVLLISDGEIHDKEAHKAASDLKRAGHKLINLGIGTEQGAPVPLAGGRLVRQNEQIFTSRLQRDTLQSLARAGGGHYADLLPQSWDKIKQEIDRLQLSLYRAEVRTQMGQPLFPVFILLALVMLFWRGLNRPQGLAIILAGMFAFQLQPADAAPWTEAKGLSQLNNNDNQGALETYRQLENYAGLMGKGAAAYRLGQWQTALHAFEQASAQANTNQQKARAAYNRGNALIQLGELDQAISAFELAIELRGSYPRASHNLTLLNKAKQEWGGQKQAKQEHEQKRPGANQQEQQVDIGAGGDASNALLSGQSDQGARLSKTKGDQRGEREKHDVALSQSLAQWSQMKELSQQPPAQAWQQYQNLKEDNQAMLQRRFEIEDKRALGQVEEKPW